MYQRVLIINKCQDCKYNPCNLKACAGGIPSDCKYLLSLEDLDSKAKELLLKVEEHNQKLFENH